MSINTKNRTRPLPWMMVILLLASIVSCEYYEEETYVLSTQEQLICDRLADTLSHDITAADLRLFGPDWTGKNIVSALESSVRIGESWYDEDFVLRPDVLVFIDGADTVAAAQITAFAYDESMGQADSLQIVYLYNPAGSISFDGLSMDTILVAGSHTAPVYIDFSLGIVSASSDWNISIDAGLILQTPTGKVHRKENTSILSFSKAPTKNYLADTPGFEIAAKYLEADSIYLTSPDSLMAFELESKDDAGYVLWDRQAMGSSDIIFNATDFMSINVWVWDANGTKLEPNDESMSMETIAYCHDLKTRVVYELEGQTYLIQFKPHEEMVDQDFNLVIVEGE
jgi:hypothetical protein